jgi:PAS domain S-box-containing protein
MLHSATVRKIVTPVRALDSRYFPLLLDVIDQSIFSIDKNGVITFFNHAAEELTGYRAGEIVGRRCAEIFKTELCTSGCPLQRTLESGQRVIDRRVRITAKDGRSIPVSVSTAILCTPEGDVLGGVEVIKDLSSLMHLKRQLDGKYCFEDIISKNDQMHRIFELLPLVAQSDSTVLVLGASGTGKELVAKAIHHQSNRSDRPFVAVNCAAMPETLIESELFGYIKGAFTDAKRDKPGRIAQADGGTLFLDEVGDLPLKIQVKLLRFLQDRVYEPLGATFTTRADVRVISATNRDLEAMVTAGDFRQDLYYRLNVMQFRLPPLCERPEDIPLLVQHFVRRFRHITGKRIDGISDDALSALLHYPFPGNIRELENLIERAFILGQGSTIGLEHLPGAVFEKQQAPESGLRTVPLVDLDPLKRAECRTIRDALRRNHGNRSHTASDLGIHRSTLIRKIKLYGI